MKHAHMATARDCRVDNR